jgi:hypothetical protein
MDQPTHLSLCVDPETLKQRIVVPVYERLIDPECCIERS